MPLTAARYCSSDAQMGQVGRATMKVESWGKDRIWRVGGEITDDDEAINAAVGHTMYSKRKAYGISGQRWAAIKARVYQKLF